jgi:hypothetical protein
LIAVGALLGGKVRDVSNGRTNLFGMVVAPSSAGKDWPGKRIQQIFLGAGAEALVGAGRITSDSALEVALTTSRILWFSLDEAGEFFSQLRQAGMGSGNAIHYSTLKPALKELWSSANCLYRGKQRAEGECRKILEPHVCLWCASTPGRLYQGVNSEDLADGFIPRVLFAITDDRPEYTIQTAIPPPESITTLVNAWVSRQIPQQAGCGDILAATTTNTILVPTNSGALKIFEAFNRRCAKLLVDGEECQDKIAPLWGKGLENARRVALTIAAGDEYEHPEIGEYHATYATRLVEASTLDLIASIRRYMADSLDQHEKQKIMELVEKHKDAGISKSDLIRATQVMSKRSRDAYLAELVEAAMLLQGKHPDSGRGAWYWKPPYGLNILRQEERGVQ